ncbi:hypothetical protein [Ehrlichia muris]|uniref:Uncharacterized protein n=1 Tax=Ehrlichia muris AS145 TaxID=1423892 RepID=V9R8V9_9RICK|nr:hypothetical protein [Ehrlichia muris]AHC39738.1 hypothetical protein EMUR_03760 [Ehrlichia muris AS145]
MNRLKCDIISQVFLKFDLTSSVSFYIEVLIDRTLDCAAKYVCFEGNVQKIFYSVPASDTGYIINNDVVNWPVIVICNCFK